MLVLLSPAKSLNLEPLDYLSEPSQAKFRKRSLELVDTMKNFDAPALKKLMSISDDLAELNTSRFHNFKKVHNLKNSKAAMYTFSGDVYRGLQAESFNKSEVEFAQDHLRILSGLYGLLKPMDLIQPYRLEMGTKPKKDQVDTLYKFWDEDITKALNVDLRKFDNKLIINLASKEYFSAIKKKLLKAEVIDVHFREWKGEQLKFISYTAKVARGLLAHYIIKNKITEVESLKAFNLDGYSYYPELSSDKELYFVR